MSRLTSWAPPADPTAVRRLAAELAAAGVPVRTDRPLGPLTTFGVGGPAAVFAEPRDPGQLTTVMRSVGRHTAEQLPLLVLGRGSNLLVADSGFPGLVLRLGRGFASLRRDGDTVLAGAAASMPQLAAWTARQGLAGLEFAAAIPASVGGSVRMTAGAHGAQVADRLVSASVALPGDGAAGRWPADRLGLGYRRSALPERSVVVAAAWQLPTGDPAVIAHRLAEHREWRRRSQPLRARSCGSTFVNPPGDSAGRLIEAAGLKGTRVGAAHVSVKHANFVLVDPGGSAAQVWALLTAVRDAVHRAGGPWLTAEVRAVGDFTGGGAHRRPAAEVHG